MENIDNKRIVSESLDEIKKLSSSLDSSVDDILYYHGGKMDSHIEEIYVGSKNVAVMKFTVSDNGIGISENFLEKVFKPFERDDIVIKSNIEGYGLGLTVAKAMVDSMNGHIDVFSEVNKGSKFVVFLEINKKENLETESDVIVKPDLCGANILVAEDNVINLQIFSKVLEAINGHVHVAENGRIAVDMYTQAETGYYSMICLDINMPVMNGYDAAINIRNSGKEDSLTIPMVAVTANTNAHDIAKAYASGIDGHISKPLNVSEIYNVINKLLK